MGDRSFKPLITPEIMRILVCVHQVPETAATSAINGMSRGPYRDPGLTYRMNRFDECAVEESLRIRRTIPGSRVTALSLGPAEAGGAIRKALAMGVDDGVHVLLEQAEHVETLAKATWVAAYLRENPHFLVLTGLMSESGMHGMLGPMVAELLNRPCSTSVIKIDVDLHKAVVVVLREIDNGERELVELDLPAVLSVQTGLNTPRYPTLSNMMRAKKQVLLTVPSSSLDQPPATLIARGLATPVRMRAGRFLKGTTEEKAADLLDIMRDKGFL